MQLFKKRAYIPISKHTQINEENDTPMVPDGMFAQCPSCKKAIYTKDLGTQKICPECGYTFRIRAQKRIELTIDEDSFEEWNQDIPFENPLDFPEYDTKIQKAQKILNSMRLF